MSRGKPRGIKPDFANKISRETQAALETIPWDKIIGLRNKLAHDYGEILAERIWNISKKSKQDLLTEIEKIEEVKNYIEEKPNRV